MGDRLCGICRSALEPERVESIEGQAGGVSVRVEPVWVLGCPDRHERRYIERDYGNRLSIAIVKAFPTTLGRRLFGSKAGRCFNCRTQLTGEPTTTTSVSKRLPIQLLTTPLTEEPVTMTVEGPIIQCPSCSKTQLSPQTTSDVHDALIEAFERAGIKP